MEHFARGVGAPIRLQALDRGAMPPQCGKRVVHDCDRSASMALAIDGRCKVVSYLTMYSHGAVRP
jgi:hypothetical protein